MNPAVVVLGYERPEALQRLLSSLDRAYYPSETPVTLLISLDHAASEKARRTATVANEFEWRFGPKQVIARTEHLGVVGHFRAAGELTREFGAIVLLEDDLTVAPAFYDYARQALDAYDDDVRIAGICLYGLWFNGFTREPFMTIEDGADVFFLRVPYTQGLCFNARQWAGFEAWWATGRVSTHPDMHPAFLGFGADEWFPSLAAYMAQNGRYFCFPRVSLTTGWGDAGAHFAEASSWFQTPLLMGRRSFQMPALDDALAVYDVFFELLPDRLRTLAPALHNRDFDLDVNATKQPENLRNELVLTSRPARKVEASFGLAMYPPEMNIVEQVPGVDLVLARRDDVRWDRWSQADAHRRLHAYFWRRNPHSRQRSLRFGIARAIERLRQARRG